MVVNPAKVHADDYFDASTDEDEASQPGVEEGDNAPCPASASKSASGRTASSTKLPPVRQSASPPSLSIGPLSRGNLLEVGRFIVQRASKATNLSLSGLFHDLLGSSNLKQLRYLSIGPLTPPDAAAALLGSGLKLPNVRKLRVCGDHPALAIAKAIAGEVEGLESLEEVQWDFGYASVPNAPRESS